MADKALFRGELVRLCAENTDIVAESFLRWSRDSEYWRLLAVEPATPHTLKQIKEFIEKELFSQQSSIFLFMIRSLEDDRIIGEIGLEGVEWNHGDAFVGISIGEREYWDKGYGTDAMRVLLGYAFNELNLHRVSLTVFEYNPRAMRSYQKAGFVMEGRERSVISRDGKRYDLLFMGILREEWLAQQGEGGQ